MPLSGLVVIVAVVTVMFVLPSGKSSDTVDVAELAGLQGASTTPSNTQITVTTVQPAGPTSTPPAASTPGTTTITSPTTTNADKPTVIPGQTSRPSDTRPAPIGGLRPAWPDWVVVSNEKPDADSYSADLAVTTGGVDDVLIWLSMQNWVARGNAADATTWVLSGGTGSKTLNGTLDVVSPTTFKVTLTR